MKYFSSGITGILITLAVLAGCSKNQERLTVGDPAPLFTLQTPDGKSISLSQFKGKMILLHFWADWCADCRAEFPKLQNAYDQLKNENFEIIAVNVGQTREHVQSFIESYGLTFPMAMDEDTAVARLYHVKGLPTNYFITPNQTIHKMIIGWVNENQIHTVLSSLKQKE